MKQFNSIGVDLCSHKRIKKTYDKFGNKFVNRIMTSSEKRDFEILEKKENKKIRYMAKIFAIKEALAKALSYGIGEKLSFKDIEIRKKPNSSLAVELKNEIKIANNIKEILVSISHEKKFTIAFIVLK